MTVQKRPRRPQRERQRLGPGGRERDAAALDARHDQQPDLGQRADLAERLQGARPADQVDIAGDTGGLYRLNQCGRGWRRRHVVGRPLGKRP